MIRALENRCVIGHRRQCHQTLFPIKENPTKTSSSTAHGIFTWINELQTGSHNNRSAIVFLCGQCLAGIPRNGFVLYKHVRISLQANHWFDNFTTVRNEITNIHCMLGLDVLIRNLAKVSRFLQHFFSLDFIVGIVMGESKRRKPSPVRDNGRTRFYSEGSGQDQATERRGGQSLPDLVSGGTFRDRANSAPTRPSVATEAGRELRRISDEFESRFYPQRVRRRSLYDLLASLWPIENGGQPPRAQRRAEGSQDHNAVGSGGAA